MYLIRILPPTLLLKPLRGLSDLIPAAPPGLILHTTQKRTIFPSPSWRSANPEQLMNNLHMPREHTQGLSLAEQPIPAGRSLPRCALTHPHAHCLAGHPWDGSACGNAACGKAARSQEPNGKADKRYIQRGLEEPLLKALHHTASGCRQLSRGTETKKNPWQQLFFFADTSYKDFLRRGRKYCTGFLL